MQSYRLFFIAGVINKWRCIINTLKNVSKKVYKIYVNIGVFAIALIASCVIFSVIARYFFGISFLFLEEFITTVFAFTTFWGIGICIMEDEHVAILSIYQKFTPKFKIFATIFNYVVMIVVDYAMIKYGFMYVNKFGNQLSMGMEIPMKYMYGIIPISCVIALITIVIKFVEYIVSLREKE
ncbi:MAG: TRAP transporter small permease [Sphaerochaetaceae bacterium]|nr:TRAP transporter small permease [Sphaerochaetaceae bacterium]MDC7237297.1 TRAP transporter small permease [Sphaerochaetaceae bacterium]MDC7250078.1 TRAP transporter small permease [Sphaerochaetaceae bacterium]